MKKTFLTLFVTALLTALPNLMISAGKYVESEEDIIEKIENRYNTMKQTSPFIQAKGVTVAQSIRFIQPEDNMLQDYSKLKQIALVRHGEPDMDKTGKYTCDEANQFLRCYDSVCIIVPETPFFHLEDEEEVKVFSSPLNRALTTAHYLFGTEKEITISPEFREFENKISPTDSKKKRSIRLWTTTSRIKWMLGGGKNKGIESFSEAKQRARHAAGQLDAASGENPKVMLTAHGMLNRYIKKNLKKMGWKVVEDTGNNYFGTTILVKIEK